MITIIDVDSWAPDLYFDVLEKKINESKNLIIPKQENKEMIKPLCSAPPKLVMNPFNSGKIKLKLAMKKNIERQRSQKFLS
jgi:hypothetical protein